jgi:hypothetical protein
MVRKIRQLYINTYAVNGIVIHLHDGPSPVNHSDVPHLVPRQTNDSKQPPCAHTPQGYTIHNGIHHVCRSKGENICHVI